MPSIEVISTVLCEEVRREHDGRAIILGAAPVGPEIKSGGEVVQRIAFYVEAFVSEVQEIEIQLISEAGDDVAFATKMRLGDLPEEGSVDEKAVDSILGVLVFNKSNVMFKEPGMYQLQIRVPDQEWQTARSYFFPPRSETQAVSA